MKAQVKIPMAVKLSPFFTNFARFARQLDQHGADGLVLFNRFYQPDIDLETLEVTPEHPPEHADGDAPAAALDRHLARPDPRQPRGHQRHPSRHGCA